MAELFGIITGLILAAAIFCAAAMFLEDVSHKRFQGGNHNVGAVERSERGNLYR